MTDFNSQDVEILDVVNDSDEVVDKKSRQEIHEKGLCHREIHVWFFDKEKNLYFQQSGPNKPSAGLLDATVGGHVSSGEQFIDAAIRESEEELGILISEDELEVLLKYSGFSEYKITTKKNNFIRLVYIYKNPITNEQIKVQGDEDSLGIKKLSLSFLSDLSEEDKKIFHKFMPIHELPIVLEYISKIP